MDNPNDSNSSNNPNPNPTPPSPTTPPPPPSSPTGGTIPSWLSPSELPTTEPAATPPLPTSPWPPAPMQPETGQFGSAAPTPTYPDLNPLGPSSESTPDQTPVWTPPAQTTPTSIQPEPTPLPSDTWPAAPQPSLNATALQDQTPTWTPPAQTPPQPETPTFTSPPTAPPAGSTGGPIESTLSSLDNPWGTPTPPPPIEQPQVPAQPNWANIPSSPTENQSVNASPSSPLESAPTDLSHLISNSSQQEPAVQPASEALVIPNNANLTPEVPTLATENHRSIPKWLIGLGIGLLVLVGGASAYFILGIGQPSKTTTSLPATTLPKTAEVKPPLPIATPVPQPSTQPATGSANFGELGGSSGNNPATSAADLIRQRQQGR